MNVVGWIFCVFSLAATFIVAWILFPMAAMSEEQVLAINTPVEAELMEDVTLSDFGDTPVIDLMLYYIDNPPSESTTQSTKVRFQGC